MTQKKTMVIAAGGTGGHIFPALAVADALTQKGMQIVWLGVRGRMEERIIPGRYPIEYIPMQPLRGRGWRAQLATPWRLWQATWQARRLLKKLGADAVLSMGGFVSAPTGLAARWLGLPLVVHEQNAIAGWTNRLLAHLSKHILVAFPAAFGQRFARDIQCVGNPLRADFFNSPPDPSPVIHKPVQVLVLGGSQGARYLNTTVASILAEYVAAGKLKVKHQSGPDRAEAVQALYQEKDAMAVQVCPFIEDMPAAYAWADLVIARSGALTISEIAAMGVASVLVPFPDAVGDHQRHNAGLLVDCGAARLMDQRRVSMDDWHHMLQGLLADPEQLVVMGRQAATKMHPSAAASVARVCEEVMA